MIMGCILLITIILNLKRPYSTQVSENIINSADVIMVHLYLLKRKRYSEILMMHVKSYHRKYL